MKDLMAAVSGLFGKRYSARQKERFARYMENRARERGIKWAEDTQRLGFGVCRNLYLGDLKRAKLLLAIPYDTAARIWWPGIRYYPVHKGKNILQDTLAKGLDILLAVALIAAYYLLIFRTPSASAAEETWKLAGLLLCVLAAGKFLFGWVNGNNYVRNSASIVIALTCLDRFPAGQVAVALLDHSCCGFQGYQQLYRRLERKGLRKNLLVLDCVTSGEELHLHGLGELPELTGVQNHQLTVPECKGSVLELFPGGQILTGGQEAGGETVILDTRCGRDRQIRLDKMERTVEIIRQLVQLRGGAVEKSDFGSKEEKSK